MEQSEILILACLSGVIGLVLIVLVAIKFRNKEKDEAFEDVAVNDEAVNDEAVAIVRPRPQPLPQDAEGPPGLRNRAAANRNARARMRMAQAQRQHQADESASEDEVAELGDEIALPEGKIGKKKLAKLQMKAEKRTLREQEEREREEKKKREEQLAKIRRAEEKKIKEEEAQKEEEERKLREEEEKREQEEYEKFKMEFQVEEEGFDETTEENEQNLLREFLTYIQKSKVVILEDVAALFKLKTQAVIDRITTLQKEGQLTGVIDDRGKFIYISQTELESVAKFIRQRGRVSLSDLAEASNSLVNLNPETNEGG